MSEKILVSALRQHPAYIRKNPKEKYIEELTQILSDKKEYCFPAITVQPIPTDHPDFEGEGRYWIIDGTHRFGAVVNCKYKDIPAEIKSGLKPEESIALQIKLNNEHGLRLSPADQRNAMKMMAELGTKNKEIAQKTGMSESSVSRIVRGEQRTSDEGKSGNVKGNVKKFDPENWMKGVARLLKTWPKNRTKIIKFGLPENCGKAIDVLYTTLIEKGE